MNQPCNNQYNDPCPTCFNKNTCYPDAQWIKLHTNHSPMVAHDIVTDAAKTLFSLFQITEDPDGYPDYYLIGIFDSISAAGSQITGMYTIIDRESLELKSRSPFRDAIPYDYIIEPMRINQPVKSAYEIACIKYPD